MCDHGTGQYVILSQTVTIKHADVASVQAYKENNGYSWFFVACQMLLMCADTKGSVRKVLF